MIPKVIGFSRHVGKTTELIKLSAKERLYIVCADQSRLDHIVRLADKMNLAIPHPITVAELPLRSPYIERVLVDDVEDVLRRIIGKPVLAMTTSYTYQSLTVNPTHKEEY